MQITDFHAIYRADNIMSRSIHEALRECFKLLLTATPLQNSLLELYGLCSFIDDYTYDDLDSLKAQFSYIRAEHHAAVTWLTFLAFPFYLYL